MASFAGKFSIYRRLLGVSGFVVVLLVWQLTYTKTNFLPSPSEVGRGMIGYLMQSDTYEELAISTYRLLTGLAIAVVLGVGIALVAMESWLVRSIMTVWINVTLTLPSLLTALLCLIVFGITSLGVIVAIIIIIFPFIAAPTYDGIRTVEADLVKMARLYGFNTWSQYRDIYLPHVAVFLVGGLRNALALGWRVLIVAEIFSVRSGVGHRFDDAFDKFDFVGVIVWLILLLCTIGLVEILILSPFEKWAIRWKTG